MCPRPRFRGRASDASSLNTVPGRCAPQNGAAWIVSRLRSSTPRRLPRPSLRKRREAAGVEI